MNAPRPLLLLLSLTLALAPFGCSSDPAPKPQDEPVETSTEGEDAPLSLEEMTEQQAEEAIIAMATEDVTTMTRACQTYMEGAQKFGPEEPWHQSGPQGEVVPPENNLFPGGSDYTFTTHPEPPLGRTPLPPQMPRDARLDATLTILGTPLDTPLHYKLTYQTFDEPNGDKMCTVKADLQVISDRPEDRKEVSQSARYMGNNKNVVLTPVTLAP